jgi:Zn-dependent metalloprotease
MLGIDRALDVPSSPGERPCCFIAPPDLLSRMVESEDVDKREAALRTLAASASVRTRRSLVTQVMRELDVDVRALRFAQESDERRTVYDVEHKGSTTLPGRKVREEGSPASADDAVNDAYDGADQVYDFYNDVLGRDSIDGKGMDLVSTTLSGTVSRWSTETEAVTSSSRGR